ncbi:hypothetical protein GCM10027176_37270 [Actinoallomurus bryophytorum]
MPANLVPCWRMESDGCGECDNVAKDFEPIREGSGPFLYASRRICNTHLDASLYASRRTPEPDTRAETTIKPDPWGQ